MNKALYGLLRSALLFYKHLVVALKKYGFKVNPHNPYVANVDINNSQMTVTGTWMTSRCLTRIPLRLPSSMNNFLWSTVKY